MIDIEVKQQYNQLNSEVEKLYDHIEPAKIQAEIVELEDKLQQKDTWENPELSQKISQDLKERKELSALFSGWKDELENVEVMFELFEEEKEENLFIKETVLWITESRLMNLE